MSKTVSTSWSVCPICLKRVKATLVSEGEKVYQEKNCPDHGHFKTLVWEGEPTLKQWCQEKILLTDENELDAQGSHEGCPYDCGLCSAHKQKSCCVLLEVTQRCNLSCPVCFASAGEPKAPDPELDVIKTWYEMLMNQGGPFNIQLSGGEPTLRDDLPAIIQMGRAMGFSFFQLNTNGIRLSEDLIYVKALSDAGLNCAFLQFDTLKPEVCRALRGRDLTIIKEKAIENCKACGIGVVLVPTLVMGQNETEIGDLIAYAKARMPDVRGIHFQPIAYFGRYPAALLGDRLTLPRLMGLIEAQTGGEIMATDFTAPSSEHPMCSFNSKFGLTDEGRLKLTSGRQKGCCGAGAADQAREFVARQWSAVSLLPASTQALDSMDLFLQKAKQTLTVSAMAFQDAWNIDTDRLKQCHIHVVSPLGKLVPFCAYNLTDASGNSLYRSGV